MVKRGKVNIGRTAGYVSLSLLGIAILAMLFPAINTSASATDCDPEISTEGCLVAQASQEVGTTVSTVLSLAMQNKVELEVIPKSNGATSYAVSKLAVSTNSHAGYSVYLQAEGEDGNLTGVTSNLAGVIKNTTKENVRLEQLETNAYGYALSETTVNDNTTYSHIPTTNTAIKTTTSTAVSSSDYAYGDAYYLAFGTHIDTTLLAGQYAGSVTVSAIANPVTVTSLYDITTMQEMQTPICENTKEGYTKQLIDTRDGKSYWVAKLKDGNCWMTQNLALDITEAGLSATDTDITEDWNQDSEYPPTRTNSEKFLGSTIYPAATKANSWSFGKVTLAIPTANRDCNGGKSATSADALGEVCAQAGFVDVSDDGWEDTYVATDGTFELNGGSIFTGLVTVQKESKIYDAHYLIGNYYSFNAATAGSGGTNSTETTPEVAQGSICPKGWGLPLAGTNFDSEKGSFAYLLKQYGYIDTTLRKEYFMAPFYIVRSGNVYTPSGWLTYAGHQAKLWSKVNNLSRSNYAYFLSVATTFSPQGSDTRSLGIPIRCLAK